MNYKILSCLIAIFPVVLCLDDIAIQNDPNHELDCSGPFRFNGFPSDMRINGKLLAHAEAGPFAVGSATPGQPQGDVPKPEDIKVNKAFKQCGLYYEKEVKAGDVVVGPADNCTKSNAQSSALYKIKGNSDSKIIFFQLTHIFNGSGKGKIEDYCCDQQPITPVISLYAGSNSDVSGSLTFVVPSSIVMVKSLMTVKLKCPSTTQDSGASFNGKFHVELLKMDSSGNFILYNPESDEFFPHYWPDLTGPVDDTIQVDSNPDTDTKEEKIFTAKVHLGSGVYKIYFTFEAAGSASKEVKCPKNPMLNPTDPENILEQAGTINVELELPALEVIEN